MARKATKYNETFFRGMGGPGPLAVGLFVVLVIVVGIYLAFAKSLPFTSPGYELKATFANAVRVSDKAPVRIAGVNVGEVTGLERKGNASVVTFSVTEEGRPIREDAAVRIRPRIFLEGNFFLDVDPGSPSAAELPDQGEIPITRTSTAVQLDEILTALQTPQRANLTLLLEGLGTAFNSAPSPSDDADADPDTQGETAAAAINDAFETGADAGRTSAIVNEALLGTEPGDLTKLLAAGGRVSQTLVGREAQLQDLITNFNITAGALADESDEPLRDDPAAGADAGDDAAFAGQPERGAAAAAGAGDRARGPGSPSFPTRSPPACPGSSRRSRCSRTASWARSRSCWPAAHPTRQRRFSRRSPACRS